ncbi:PilX N-terminal domain-containing pilus assembly protein [Pseudomonas sp. PDNC002]|uniref:pilus assembly PilX family protein n=1 Tax=Pseudomonas sp. PDNC002 TaxID=2811422 RepID=UPI0031F5640B
MTMRNQSQGGAVLLVSLVMLLLLTIVGLAGLRMAQLEERMAGNLRDRQVAFQGAEAALRAGELAGQEVYRRMGADIAAYDVGAEIEWSDPVADAVPPARKPAYRLKFLRALNSEGLEVGKGLSTYGVAIEVSAVGYGQRRQPSGEPVSHAKLGGIFVIR